jgi:hypothetical protein
MVNRVRYLFDEDIRENEYYEIETLMETFLVSQATALNVERVLDRGPAPVWVEFRDLFGERRRVISWHVVRIAETTAVAREAWRAFSQLRSLEKLDESH